MLAAMNYIEENKSKADDKDSKLRQTKFLASRTINALNGGTEYEVRIMILCLLGFKSFISSEKFNYIFPWELIQVLNDNLNKSYKYIIKEIKDIKDNTTEDINNIDNNINEIISIIDEEKEKLEYLDIEKLKGAKVYKPTSNKYIFLTNAKSYLFRGINFISLSPLEFECIVEIKKDTNIDDIDNKIDEYINNNNINSKNKTTNSRKKKDFL